MKVLFSPVGSTDPISGQHDGAILHIIRVFKPEKVFLFLSSEMCDFEKQDSRYTYCISKLCELIGIKVEVNLIERPELTEVHIFDDMLLEFRNVISELYIKAEDELFVNVSSGTPAMKSALQVLASMSDRKMTPIQVSTPNKGYNDQREDVKGDYLVDLQWELNVDNDENFANRCLVSSNINMASEIKKEIIKNNIKAYDYVSAYNIAKEMRDFIDENAILLIKAGAERMKLNRKECLRVQSKVGYDMFPYKKSEECDIFECLLLEKIKIEREEYMEFMRGISPLFFAILEKILTDKLNFNIYEYYVCNKSLNNTLIKRWNVDMVKSNQLVCDAYGNNDVRESVVEVRQLVTLINKITDDSKLKNLIEDIRSIEVKLRNPVAHCITFVTDDVIKANTEGMRGKDILKKIRELAVYSGINITKGNLESYDTLNLEICKYLQ